MSKSAILVALLCVALIAQPAIAETWDCGESVAQSVAFAINTDTSACGGNTLYSGDFALNTDTSACGGNTLPSGVFALSTDTSGCGGVTVASPNYLQDTIWSPGSIKKHPLGDRVTLASLPIARAFAQRFYIEAGDRSSGIGVMVGVTAVPGRLVTVTGTVAAFDGEIVLDSPDVTLGELGAAPKPIGMNSCALKLGIELDPTGTLARVWGKAISVPEGETYYLVSDGGCPFIVLPEGVGRPAEGLDVVLNGIPGVATVGGQQVRVFRVNAQ